MFGRKRKPPLPESRGGPADAYAGLRAMALGVVAEGRLAPPAPDHADVAGLVVDIAGGGGHATVVALADGTTSLYTSGGGGVIGAGEHAHVAAATRRLLVVAQAHLAMLTTSPDTDNLPPPGRVRVHTLTPRGDHAVDLADDVFWNPAGQPVEALVVAIQDVLTALREASPDRA